MNGTNRFPKNCGLIINTIRFWPNLTAKETLEVVSSINSIIDNEEIIQVLKRVGLNPDDKRKVKKYSLGMKQKLAIAQAIMEKPNLLLLDEPTNSLDKDSRELFNKIILEEKRRGCTIIISSHIEENLIKNCDVIYLLDSGKIYNYSENLSN